jgi:hypothetical protein
MPGGGEAPYDEYFKFDYEPRKGEYSTLSVKEQRDRHHHDTTAACVPTGSYEQRRGQALPRHFQHICIAGHLRSGIWVCYVDKT